MLLKTCGIVLSNVRYNDKYCIAHIYTEQKGRVAYIVPKSNRKSSKIASNLFSPLAIIELEAEHLPSREIQRIKEVRNIYPFQTIYQNISKTSVLFFLSDFLSKVLKDSNDPALIYQFIRESIHVLDISERGIANFHLVFMLRLIRFLGFDPNLENYHPGCYFDLMAGEFTANVPFHRHYIDKEESMVLSRLTRINYGNMHRFAFGRNDRNQIVSQILEYYRLHVQNFSELKSLDVLHELF